MTQGKGPQCCLRTKNYTRGTGPRARAQGETGQEAGGGEAVWAGCGSGPLWALVQIWKVFLSPFESRPPWPKRSAFQILQADCAQPCRACTPPPPSFSCLWLSSQHPSDPGPELLQPGVQYPPPRLSSTPRRSLGPGREEIFLCLHITHSHSPRTSPIQLELPSN